MQCHMKHLGQHCTWFLLVQCWPMFDRQLFWLKEPIQCCVYQARTILHMSIVYSMLSTYIWDNIAQENYWCNVGPDHIVICLLENNHIATMLSWSVRVNIALENYLYILTHSPQTNLRRKIICNVVWICLGQHCTRKSPVHLQKTNFMKKITHAMLYRPYWNKIA